MQVILAAILTIGIGVLFERRVELEAEAHEMLDHRVVLGNVRIARRRDVIAQRDLVLGRRRRRGGLGHDGRSERDQ